MNTFIASVLGLALTLSGTAAFGEMRAPTEAFVGLKLGLADSSNVDPRFTYGLDLGGWPLSRDLGLSGSVFGLTSSGPEYQYKSRISHFGVGLDYSLAKILPEAFRYLRAGIRVGVGSVDLSGHTPPDQKSHTNLAMGVGINQDWMIAKNVSLGAELSALWLLGNRGVSTVYALGNARFWF